MDDDGAPRVARAGRRAGKKLDLGDGDAPPEKPSQGAFGMDFGGGGGGGGEDDNNNSSGWGAPSGGRSGGLDALNTARSGGMGDDPDDAPPPPRARNNDMMGMGDAPPPRARNNDMMGMGDAPSPPSRPPPPSGPRAPPTDILAENDKKYTGVSRRKQEQLKHGNDEVSKKNLKYEELTAGPDGIVDIPELEEEGREDLSHMVAEAPKVRVQKVQGMEQLEEEMHFKLPPSDDRDIDLSLLTAVLCSSEQVHEEDELWDPDIILTEVGSALYSEKEKAEGEGADKADEPATGKEPAASGL